MSDIFSMAKATEGSRKAKRDAAVNLAKERERMKHVTNARRFFEGPDELEFAEENRIAKEKNAAADAYEEKHGRGSDIRYPGYRWVYGFLIKDE